MNTKIYIILIFVLLFSLPYYAVAHQCKSGAVVAKSNSSADISFPMGNASIKFIGFINDTKSGICAYDYSLLWGGGRMTRRLLIASSEGKYVGSYAMDIVYYKGVYGSKILAIGSDDKLAEINLNYPTGLPPTIYFDGEVIPLMK